MSTLISEQASNAAQTTADTSPVPADALPSLESTPVDQLDQLLAQALSPKDTAPAPPVTNEPATEQTPTPDTAPADTEAPAGETPPQAPESKRILPHRVSTSQFNEIEQEAIALGKALKDEGEEVPSLKERIEIIERRHAEAAATPPPEDTTEKELSELDAEIAAAALKKDELVKSLGIEEYDAEQARLAELHAKKANIEARKAQAEQHKVSAFSKARDTAVDAAKHRFPDAGDRTTPLGQEIESLISEIRGNPDHPDRAVLQTTNAPLFVAHTAATRLAERLAQENGTTVARELIALMEKASATPAQQAAQTPAPQAQTPKKITPAGGAASIPPAAPPSRKALDLSSPESFNIEELEKAMPTPSTSGYFIRQ